MTRSKLSAAPTVPPLTLSEAERHLLLSVADLPEYVSRASCTAMMTATDRYRYAHWLAQRLENIAARADQASDDCRCAEPECADGCALASGAREARDHADAALELADAARLAWLASDDARTYSVAMECGRWQIEAAPSEIERRIRDEVKSWPRDLGATVWWGCDYSPHDPTTGERLDRSGAALTIQLDPEAPLCVEDGHHDWEQVGVRASGAGVVYRDACVRCGAIRESNTDGHRHDDGTGGHFVVAYFLCAEEVAP